jgi:hypothetical protein
MHDKLDDGLVCRLLCASNAAYGIDFSEATVFRELQPYFDQAGFATGDPVAFFTAGANSIHGALVGTLSGPDPCVVVAYRGTHPPNLNGIPDVARFVGDWANNFEALPIPVPEVPGQVHAGFWEGVDSLWSPLFLDDVQRRLRTSPHRRLYVTGHSKGGAMAHLAGMRFAETLGLEPAAIVSFAGARPGTQDFADAYHARRLNSRRYEYGDDLVPHLPPSDVFLQRLREDLRKFEAIRPNLTSIFSRPNLQHLDTLPRLLETLDRIESHNYVSVGQLHYLTPFGDAVGDSTVLKARRMLSLARLLMLGRFKTIGFEHAINCGSGYMGEICPDTVCH